MNKNKHRTANISSEEMSTNSYNTSEDEEDIANQNLKNSIRRKKERMNKFFLENPNLLNYFDFKNNFQNKENKSSISNAERDFVWKKSQNKWTVNNETSFSKKVFLEDLNRRQEQERLSEIDRNKRKMLKILRRDVNEHANLKDDSNLRALEQLFKKINIFKTKVLEMDKSPFIDTILEEEVDYQSEHDSEDSNQYKKHELKKGAQQGRLKTDELEYYSFKKKIEKKSLSTSNQAPGTVLAGDAAESEFKNSNEVQEDYQFKFFKNNKFEKGGPTNCRRQPGQVRGKAQPEAPVVHQFTERFEEGQE